jgi:ribosome-binding factor A
MPRARSRGNSRGNLGPSQRQLRVGEVLRHTLATILFRRDIRDPDLAGVSVTITQVIPSGDMRHATVYCEPLGGKDAAKIIAALNRHKAYLRGEMGHLITLRFTPELRFVEDVSFTEAEKIENILKSARVQADLLKSQEEPAPDDAAGGQKEPASSSEAVGQKEEKNGPQEEG